MLTVMQHDDNEIDARAAPRACGWGLRSRLAPGAAPIPTYLPEANAAARAVAEASGGTPYGTLLDPMLGIGATAHILGGAVIAASPGEGVVDTAASRVRHAGRRRARRPARARRQRGAVQHRGEPVAHHHRAGRARDGAALTRGQRPGARSGRARAYACRARRCAAANARSRAIERRSRCRAHESGRLVRDPCAPGTGAAQRALDRGDRTRAAPRHLGRQRQRGVEQPRRRRHLVDEPEVVRRHRVERRRSQHHRAWPRRADGTGEPLGATGARRDRRGDLDKSDPSGSPCTITRRSQASASSNPPASASPSMAATTTCGSAPSRSSAACVRASSAMPAAGEPAARAQGGERRETRDPDVGRPGERVGHGTPERLGAVGDLAEPEVRREHAGSRPVTTTPPMSGRASSREPELVEVGEHRGVEQVARGVVEAHDEQPRGAAVVGGDGVGRERAAQGGQVVSRSCRSWPRSSRTIGP